MNREIADLREVIVKLVPLLTGKGLKVTQIGSQAYVEADPRTAKPLRVNIPSIPDNATSDFIAAVAGFIDHEVAHVLFTDWKVYGGDGVKLDKFSPEGRALTMAHNIIEDTMIERRIVETFPGAERNLDQLHKHFLEKITAPAVKAAASEEEKFNYLIVPMMRALSGQEIFQEFLDKNGHWELPAIKDLHMALSSDALKILKTARTTADTLIVAQEVHDILFMRKKREEEAERQKQAQQQAQQAQQAQQQKQQGQPQQGKSEDKPEKEAGAGNGTGERKHEEKHEEEAEGASQGNSEGKSEEGEDQDGESKQGTSAKAEPEKAEDESEEEADAGGADGAEPEKAEPEAEPEAGSADGEDGAAEGDDEAGQDEPGADAGDEDESDGDGSAAGAGDDDGSDDEDAGSSASEGDDEGDDGEGLSEGEAQPEEEDEEFEGHKGGETGGTDEEYSTSEPMDHSGAGGEAGKSMFDLDPANFTPLDLSNAMAQQIEQMAKKAISAADYSVFTKDDDRIEPFKVPDKQMRDQWVPEMDERVVGLIGPMQKEIERMMAAQTFSVRTAGHRSGRLHSASLHRVMQGDPRVFQRKEEHRAKDTAVMLLVDNSGSMHGAKMATAMMSAYALAQTLERVGIPNEVVGFTTGTLSRGAYEQLRKEQDKGIHYNRNMSIIMPIYKDFGERVSPLVKRRIAFQINVQEGLNNNIDGESLEYAALRLLPRREKRKVMLVLSDGQPVGSNAPWHLKHTVERLTKMGVETVGIGINSNAVQNYYPRSLVLNNVEDLPKMVMGELRRILSN